VEEGRKKKKGSTPSFRRAIFVVIMEKGKETEDSGGERGGEQLLINTTPLGEGEKIPSIFYRRKR